MWKKGIKLRYIIGLLVTFTILLTFLTGWYVSNRQLKETLIENRLEQNYQYTQNVVKDTSLVINNMNKNLHTLAKIIGSEAFTQSDLDNWFEANNHYFNSLFTTDDEGVVQLMSPVVVPNNPNQVQPGTKIASDLMKQTLKEQKPFISEPYFSQTGNLMLLISQPILDGNGEYRGVVDGTIYLERESSLQRLLTSHDFLVKSTLFVVDRNGSIIYHPEASRIGEDISEHPLIQKVMKGHSGAEQITNRLGKDYFSGYGFIEDTGWGVVMQTPISVIDQPLQELRKEMILLSLPVLFFIMIIALISTMRIVKPLDELAAFSKKATSSKNSDTTKLNIKTSIQEVRTLNHDIQKHLELLNKEIQIDGLTNLYNRRTFDSKMQDLVDSHTFFSLIMLDIDHFKEVNDSYRHLVGDDVLRFLALKMKELVGDEGICFRYGGEEFTIILKGKNSKEAFHFAEKFRKMIAETNSPTGEPITLSLGVTTYARDEEGPEEIINQADIALYQSKNKGRNRTTVYGNDSLKVDGV